MSAENLRDMRKDSKKRAIFFENTLQEALQTQEEQALLQWVSSITEEDIPVHVIRQLIASFLEGIMNLPLQSQKKLLLFLLERAEARSLNFEEQNIVVKETLSNIYETEKDYLSAAQILSQLPLDGNSRNISEEYKLRTYIKIAQLFLSVGDSNSAESFLNRASAAITFCDNEQIKHLFKICHAQVLEAKRKFAEAAWHYYELSQIDGKGGNLMNSNDSVSLDFLNHAVICAIFSPAGPQRSRILTALFRDERSRSLLSFDMLQAVYMDRILKKKQMETFSDLLASFQLKTTSGDGQNIFEQSLVEHNLLAVSKIYNNIGLEELGSLLEIPPGTAENLASKMIYEGRLKGAIDQVNRIIEFESPFEEILLWDARLESFCLEVDHCYERIIKKYPYSTEMEVSMDWNKQ
eukprot:jgi/Galph1/3052/GphlegSOOS_G1753.1